jgi:Mor family transcriptional regulator
MGYQNGKTLLPENLLVLIQEYIDGEYIYIPRKSGHKRAWGTANKSRQWLTARNREIFRKYVAGRSVPQLAEEYYLAPKTVYGIVAKMKT